MVASELSDGLLGTANLAGVIGKMVDADLDISRFRELLAASGVRIEPLLEEDAELAAALRSIQQWPFIVAGRPLLPCPHRTEQSARSHDCRPSMG
jgi:hypothetical protein